MAYTLEGQLLEVCTCRVLCPCWIGEDPDFGTCDGTLAWKIEKGTINGVDVSGLSIFRAPNSDFAPPRNALCCATSIINVKSQGGTKMAYTLEGQLLEVCTCRVLCPCWIGEDPDFGTCDGTLAWKIEKGTINGVDVSGLSICLLAHIPGNILQGNWRVVVYVDEQASDEQQEALLGMWARRQIERPETSITVIDLEKQEAVASIDTLKNMGLDPNLIVLLPEWNDPAGH